VSGVENRVQWAEKLDECSSELLLLLLLLEKTNLSCPKQASRTGYKVMRVRNNKRSVERELAEQEQSQSINQYSFNKSMAERRLADMDNRTYYLKKKVISIKCSGPILELANQILICVLVQHTYDKITV